MTHSQTTLHDDDHSVNTHSVNKTLWYSCVIALLLHPGLGEGLCWGQSSSDPAAPTQSVSGARATPPTSASDPEPAKASSTLGAASSSSGSEWTGLYVGAHGGLFGGSSTWSATQAGLPDLSGSLNTFHAYRLRDGAGSVFGGLTAGFNRTIRPSRLVIGGEADVTFAAEPAADGIYSDAANAVGTVRGRVGYGANGHLSYATGGLAWTRETFGRRVPAADGTVTTDQATGGRIGWTIGAGFEAAVARGWTGRVEYFYSRFGDTRVTFPSGAFVTSDLSMHELRLGLNYRFGEAGEGTTANGDPSWRVIPLELENWSAHGQTTYLHQYAPTFHAPYKGPNSLASNVARETWDATLYLGRRLWTGGELWINPEIDQGFGLSNTLGVAGFPSGEAYKVGFTHPYLRVPRVMIRQTFNLGGAAEKVDAAPNQFAGSQTANRVVITAGKFSVSDIFDTITYAHDPRNDFMNWTLVDAGTFDYAADAWSFTYGAAVEWYQGRWTARGGLYDLSIVPNSVELDHHFNQYQVVYELEHRHAWEGRPGKVALVGFVTRGRMGRFDDAVALSQQTGMPANIAAVRRYAGRPGVNVNVEQQIDSDVGLFGRIGWADGRFEPYEFTDVDRTVSLGVSFGGKRWGRAGDTFGVAGVINDISSAHTAFLKAGGLGILVGDGQLPHPGTEDIIETYYRLPLASWQVTADYQFIVNPSYNRDRGPVSVLSIRFRVQF
jgi:high affinity Mn2+ porin